MEDARRQRWECRCGGQPCGFRDLGWKPKRGSWESPRHVSWNYSAHQSSHAGCRCVSGICLLAGFVFGWPVSCLCRGSTGRARTGPERSALLRRCTSLLRLTELLKVEFWVFEKFFSLLRAASFHRVDSFSREDNSSALCHSRYPPGEGSLPEQQQQHPRKPPWIRRSPQLRRRRHVLLLFPEPIPQAASPGS